MRINSSVYGNKVGLIFLTRLGKRLIMHNAQIMQSQPRVCMHFTSCRIICLAQHFTYQTLALHGFSWQTQHGLLYVSPAQGQGKCGILMRSRIDSMQCDATRPQCSRCTRFGRTCPGYPDTFAFKSYNGASSRLSPAPKSDSSLQVESRTDQQAVASIAAPAQLQRDPPSLPPYIPTTCTDSSSLGFFFHHHVLIVDKSPCGGHLAFLPDFYREKETEPCLRYAILSIGYLSLFKTHRARIFWVQAARNYSAALAALAAAISTTESAVRDEVFASALFLSMFTVRPPKGTESLLLTTSGSEQ